jgi:thymidylate kinase
MLKDKILPRSIGFEGPDFVNKTRFSLITLEMLRRNGQEAIYVPLPFLKNTITGRIFSHTREIARESVPMLFMTNRLEILPVLEKWVDASPKNWVVNDRTKMVGPVYAWATIGWDIHWYTSTEALYPDSQVGILFKKPLSESRRIMLKRAQSGDDFKKAFDADMALQAKVREGFDLITSGRPNWSSINVSGFAKTEEAFRRWEIEKALKVWRHIIKQVGRPDWEAHAKEHITQIRDGMPDDVEPIRKAEMLPVRKELFRNLYGNRGGREKVLSTLFSA